MRESIPERDWKYLRKIQQEMLDSLCERINRQARDLLQSQAESEHDRYLALYRHVRDSDKIVAACFNDWRRSKMLWTIPVLLREGLLTKDHLSHMSDETTQFLHNLDRWQEISD